jgi:hypothetical protein
MTSIEITAIITTLETLATSRPDYEDYADFMPRQEASSPDWHVVPSAPAPATVHVSPGARRCPSL